MKVTESTIKAIEAIRLSNLESGIVEAIGQHLGLGPAEALQAYYTSEVCAMIERNDNGLQFLDASYLAEVSLALCASCHLGRGANLRLETIGTRRTSRIWVRCSPAARTSHR